MKLKSYVDAIILALISIRSLLLALTHALGEHLILKDRLIPNHLFSNTIYFLVKLIYLKEAILQLL